MKAKKKPLDVVTPDELGVSTASTVKTLKVEAAGRAQCRHQGQAPWTSWSRN